MPQRLFANAVASSTCASAINNSQTTITLQSTGAFSVPAASQQFSATILDTGNPAYNAASPLTTPYEYVFCTANNTGTNTLTVQRGQGGTSAKAFFAGATISQTFLADDINASFLTKLAEVTLNVSSTSVVLPPSGALSQAYRHLLIMYQGVSTAAAVGVQFNGDAAAHYDWQNWYTSGTAPSSVTISTALNASSIFGGVGGAIACGGVILVPNYSNPQGRGVLLGLAYAVSSGTLNPQFSSGDWSTPAAITSVTLTGLTFNAGSNFTIYGIP